MSELFFWGKKRRILGKSSKRSRRKYRNKIVKTKMFDQRKLLSACQIFNSLERKIKF